jgi:hypothetical protein
LLVRRVEADVLVEADPTFVFFVPLATVVVAVGLDVPTETLSLGPALTAGIVDVVAATVSAFD